MSLFVWGSCAAGQLGIGGNDETTIKVPKILSDVEGDDNRRVKEVSCGLSHSILLLDCGSIFSCGSNDFHQLGRDGPCKRFRQIAYLSRVKIMQIACGASFTLCLSSKGEIYSWGCNDHGQLGRADARDNSLKNIESLNSHFVVHIVCGARHSMCLTRTSEIFAWGSNEDGQLGIGLKKAKIQPVPVPIVSLHTVSVRQLACGGNFSLCLSVSGTLFSWGSNQFGQLGLGDNTNRDIPCPCVSLKTIPVMRVCCGESHTVILTCDGGIFTCGAGDSGQLGHNNRNNILIPTKVFEFMGCRISHISCGRKHTMALITETGQLMTFGSGSSGQLGVDSTTDFLIPTPIKGSWTSDNGNEKRCHSHKRINSYIIKNFYSGYGDSCYIIADKWTKDEQNNSGKLKDVSQNLNIDFISVDNVDRFLHSHSDSIDKVELDKLTNSVSTPSCINASFLCENHFCVTSRHHGVDLDKINEFFTTLNHCEEQSNLRVLVMNALMTLVDSLRYKNYATAECLRIYLMIPQAFCLFMPDWISSIVLPYCRALNMLDSTPKKYVEKWFAFIPLRHVRKCVDAFINSLKICIRKVTSLHNVACGREIPKPVMNADVHSILDALQLIHLSNASREVSLARDAFYINELPDILHISAEYYHWIARKQQQSHTPSLCDYPFIFDGVSKSLMLQMDAQIQMAKASEKVNASNVLAFFNRNIFAVDLPDLIFKIRRDNILADTVFNLEMVNQFDLKKPLKVVFLNEEAQDEGGVRKEYLMLFFKELMNPNFAMFRYYEESRMLWFHEHTFEDPQRFALVGTMCGLSIYNSSLVDLNFPLALYKKLLSRNLCLDDLKELDPTLGRSLQSILDYDNIDFEEVFCLTFSIVNEMFGEPISVNLKPNGENMPVTLNNKTEYVDLYMDYVFNISCKEQYKAFHVAFHNVFACDHESLLNLFQPIELQTLLVGNEQYDWSTLRRTVTYKGEYWSGHPVICWFWEAFDEFTTSDKKQFLTFLTGNDRVPIQGMTAIKLFIQPSGAGESYLPVAHTCFNLLDLPKYKSKQCLSEKLRVAIGQSEGFGLV